VRLIYLFGSRAKGEARTDSDWDIALMNECKIPAIDLWELKELIANEFGAEIDLIDLLQSTTVLNLQVIEHGALLYDKNSESALFETQIISMYSRLQEDRKDIVSNFVDQIKRNSHG